MESETSRQILMKIWNEVSTLEFNESCETGLFTIRGKMKREGKLDALIFYCAIYYFSVTQVENKIPLDLLILRPLLMPKIYAN